MAIRILLLILLAPSAFAQNNGIFRIYFTDKNNSSFSISQPEDFLSAKSILRRSNSSIAITTQDLPLTKIYVDSILSFPNVILKAKSKWFNCISVETDSVTLNQLLGISFVANAERLKTHLHSEIDEKLEPLCTSRAFTATTENYYGQAFGQIEMLNGHYLHNEGYRGAGMTITVIDAGFPNLNEMPAFAKLFNENRVLGTYNFVHDTSDVFSNSHFHGSLVMSCMGAEDPFSFVGTAPDASYYFFITEDADSESPLEEDNWVEAAEYADSAGTDLINTSLGYTTFDDSTLNHSYSDMDGNTTFISRGADIAASKGILLVCSAGNSGSSSWFHIGAPGDADSVMTVGAVDANGVYADFSSKGFASDGDIKPNIAAQGLLAALIWPGGNISLGSGTSFSSPISCGMAACLWQAHPQRNNMEIINAIEMSSTRNFSPDSLIGYGIPDFWKAHQLLSGTDQAFTATEEVAQVYPNPFTNELWLEFYPGTNSSSLLQIFDLTGRLIYESTISHQVEVMNRIRLFEAIQSESAGFYIIKLISGEFVTEIKVEYLPE